MLGEGAYGEVYICRHKATRTVVAIKKVFKELAAKAKMTKSLITERRALAAMDNPFIVKLYSYFEDAEHNYFVLEYCPGGDLGSYMRSFGKRMPVKIARYYIAELIYALEYLKKMKLVHRDIKPENILLDENGHIRLTDFGTVKIYGKLCKASLEYMKTQTFSKNTFCGTASYISPEILNSRPCSFASDIWSLGVSLFWLVSGKYPFNSPSPYLLFKKIKDRKIDWPEGMDEQVKDFIDSTLHVDAKKRLGSGKSGYKRMKEHPFFTDFNFRKVKKAMKANKPPRFWKKNGSTISPPTPRHEVISKPEKKEPEKIKEMKSPMEEMEIPDQFDLEEEMTQLEEEKIEKNNKELEKINNDGANEKEDSFEEETPVEDSTKHQDKKIEITEKEAKNWKTKFEEGRTLVNSKQYQEAIVIFTECLEFERQHTETYYLRGVSYYRTDQFDPALKDVVQAISMDNTNHVFFSLLGYIYFSKGELKIALEVFHQAMERKPHHEYYYVCSMLMDKLGLPEKCLQYINKAIELKPEHEPYMQFKFALSLKRPEASLIEDEERKKKELLRQPEMLEEKKRVMEEELKDELKEQEEEKVEEKEEEMSKEPIVVKEGQYAVIKNPYIQERKQYFLDERRVIEGPAELFLFPKTELESINDVHILSRGQVLEVEAIEYHDGKESGTVWQIRGPCRYIPNRCTKVIGLVEEAKLIEEETKEFVIPKLQLQDLNESTTEISSDVATTDKIPLEEVQEHKEEEKEVIPKEFERIEDEEKKVDNSRVSSEAVESPKLPNSFERARELNHLMKKKKKRSKLKKKKKRRKKRKKKDKKKKQQHYARMFSSTLPPIKKYRPILPSSSLAESSPTQKLKKLRTLKIKKKKENVGNISRSLITPQMFGFGGNLTTDFLKHGNDRMEAKKRKWNLSVAELYKLREKKRKRDRMPYALSVGSGRFRI